MLDTRTLIFMMSIVGFVFALLVSLYLRRLSHEMPYLHRWKSANLLLGIGFLLVWLRPFLPSPLHPFGSLLIPLAIAFQLSAYWGFLGRPNWQRLPWLVWTPMALLMLIAMFLDSSRNSVLITSSVFNGLMYSLMAYLMLSASRKNRLLVFAIGTVDLLMALILFSRAGIAFVDSSLVPYTNTYANSILYLGVYLAMTANGFGFLLLVKQDDDASLQLSLDDLEHAKIRESELLAIASHEFRTPAAMIKASLDSLSLLAEQMSPEAKKRIENIRHASNRLNDLANTLLVRDRLRDSSIKPKIEKIKLDELLREVIAVYPPDFVLSSIELAEGGITVLGDESLLRVALHNLIDNAISHNSDKGAVSLSLINKIDNVEIHIADLGNGIPDNLKEKIFERFVSGRGDLAKGLGLSIVRSIARLHDGHVYALDNSPTGTLMVFTLPQLAP